jgi:predicted nuclease with TOPRIM domain
MSEEIKETKSETVSREAYEKALTEKKNVQKAIEERDAKLAAMQEKIKELSEGKHRAEGNLEEILKAKEKELIDVRSESDAWKSKFENKDSEIKTGIKAGKLRQELEKMGASSDSISGLLRLADLNSMKYDEDHKVVLGAEEVARQVKDMMPSAFGRQTPGVNHSAATTVNAGPISLDQWRSMSHEDKKKNERAFYESQGIKIK